MKPEVRVESVVVRKFTVEMDEDAVLAFLATYQLIGGSEAGPRGKLKELNDVLLSHFQGYTPWDTSVVARGEGIMLDRRNP